MGGTTRFGLALAVAVSLVAAALPFASGAASPHGAAASAAGVPPAAAGSSAPLLAFDPMHGGPREAIRPQQTPLPAVAEPVSEAPCIPCAPDRAPGSGRRAPGGAHVGGTASDPRHPGSSPGSPLHGLAPPVRG